MKIDDLCLLTYPERVQTVYKALRDELSREIFRARFMYQLTGDSRHLIKIHSLAHPLGRKTLLDLLATLTVIDRSVVMYGSGKYAERLYYILKGMNVEVSLFCDSDLSKTGTVLHGVPVISPHELIASHQSKYVLISSAYHLDEIYNSLINIRYPMENVFVPGNYSEQYFGESFSVPRKDEVLVDAGAYTGDTIKRFIKHCGNDFKRIYALEPSIENFKHLCNTFCSEDRVTLCENGAWSCDATLEFNNSLTPSTSSIVRTGTGKIKTTTIDSLVGDELVSYIKMDIEGAELEALKGSKMAILNNKPRLAISVYHKPEDIITIPVFLHSLVPEYNFYIRHHSPYPSFSETVLYATTCSEEVAK